MAYTSPFQKLDIQDTSRDYANLIDAYKQPGLLAGQYLDKYVKDKRQAEQDARQQTLDDRATSIYNRQVTEQEAQDMFNTNLAKGKQVYGGVLNPLLQSDADKYALTQEEQTKANDYFSNGIYDPELARKAGDVALADKLAGQLNMSKFADTLPTSGLGNESRIEMLERGLKSVADKGIAPTTAMVKQLEEARLAQDEAEKSKSTQYEKQVADSTKNYFDALTTHGGAVDAANRKGGGIRVDPETNQLVIDGAGAFVNTSKNPLKETTEAYGGLQETLLKAKGGKEDKAALLEAGTSEYMRLLKSGVTPKDAAAAVANGIVSNDPWYNVLGDPEAGLSSNKVNEAAVQSKRVSDLIANTQSSNTTASNVANSLLGSAKADAAKSEAGYYANSVNNSNRMLAGLGLTPEERRNAALEAEAKKFGLLGGVGKSVVDATPTEAYKFTGKTVAEYSKPTITGTFDENRYIDNMLKTETQGGAAGLAARSSGGNGSYYGIGQMSEDSFNEIKHRMPQGTTFEDYKNDKTGAVQKQAVTELTRNNIKQLESKKLPVTDFTVWLAHNQGVNGANQILSGKVSDEVLFNVMNNLPKDVLGGNLPRDKDGMLIKNEVMKIGANNLMELDPINKYMIHYSGKFDNAVDGSKVSGKDLFAKVEEKKVGPVEEDKSLLAKFDDYVKQQSYGNGSKGLLNTLADTLDIRYNGKPIYEEQPNTQSSAAINIVRKLNEGGTLTANEQTWLNNIKSTKNGANLLKTMGLR